MIRLILLAIGAWATYRVVEENGLLEDRKAAMLPPPTSRSKTPRRRGGKKAGA